MAAKQRHLESRLSDSFSKKYGVRYIYTHRLSLKFRVSFVYLTTETVLLVQVMFPKGFYCVLLVCLCVYTCVRENERVREQEMEGERERERGRSTGRSVLRWFDLTGQMGF